MANDEPLLTLTEAAKLQWLPRRRKGARPHLTTLIRWVTVGVDGVRLKAWRVGNAWCTTECSLREFFSELATDSKSPAIPDAGRKRGDDGTPTAVARPG
jgi:hypothetical protein